METKDAILKRHSVRYFKDQVVKLETLKNIVALAQHAPSWVDSQPWKVYLATGETLKKLKDLHAKNVANGKTANPDWKPMHRVDWDAFPQTNMANLNLERSNFLTKPEQEIEWPMFQASFYHAPAIFYLTIPKKAPRWASFD